MPNGTTETPMANKKTAIQWLFEQTIKHNGIVPVDVIEKAIEMEEEQIVDAFYSGAEAEGLESGEDYYVKTYDQ